jgi:hypothetical protein
MKRNNKISLSQLTEMVKAAMNEDYVGGINYDNVLAAELKQRVGNLDKLVPYVLDLGDGKMDVQSDSSGKIHVTDVDSGKKVKIFKDIDDFLRGIKYGPIRITEEGSMEGHMEGHKDHEATMAKGELRSLVKNAKSIYEKISDGDELPGWVSSYVTLASDYMNSVNQYMEEKVNGEQSLDESEGFGKEMSIGDIATKYDIQRTGASGKFSFKDFQPVLDEGEPNDKYALALNFANMFLGRNFGLSWDDLPDINSLWDCVDDSDSIDELISSVKQACKDRIAEEGGDEDRF